MSELDVLLRDSLGRLAEPGDPTGVVEALRARLQGADSTGDDSAGGGGSGATGTGGGGAGSGLFSGWVPLVIVGALVGGGGGIALGFIQSTGDPADGVYAPMTVSASGGVPAAACPGGAAVAELDAGARVLALGRSEDSQYLAVRNPGAIDSLVWISMGAAIVDDGADPAALPIRGCDEGGPITKDSAKPEPDSTDPGPAPKPDSDPEPPADAEDPALQVGAWSESYVNGPGSCPTPPLSATITVVATDNVGVSSVTATSSNGQVSVSGPSKSGNNYTFTVTYSGATDSSTVLTFTARDAANNTANGSSPSLPVLACFG